MAASVLSQGPSLSQAGTDLLRSKSLDRNSYDSGDWFNALHWDCRDGNGFGRGLPPAADNQDKWPYAKPLLAAGTVAPNCAQIDGLGRLPRPAHHPLHREGVLPAHGGPGPVGAVLPLSGKDETPGVITMRLGKLVVVINAAPDTAEQRLAAPEGKTYALHPVQAEGADSTVKRARYDGKSATFTVPGRTAAIFALR